jgi:hypothetical protein
MGCFLKSSCAIVLLFSGGNHLSAVASAQTTERVSVSSAEDQVWAYSGGPSVNWDGSLVAFDSYAKRLGSHDTNNVQDVFVRNRVAGTTRRVSLSSSGVQGDNTSVTPFISANGRFVAFHSLSTTLVPGDTNGKTDIFVRDRRTGTTERVSLSSGAGQSNGDSYYGVLSGDGRYVAFQSGATNLVPGDPLPFGNVYVRDRTTGVTTRVSVSSTGAVSANSSSSPSLSRNGRFVGFQAFGDDLVSGDANGATDALLHDRVTGTTELVSLNSSGGQGNDASFAPTLSADGRYAAFGSWATNLASGDSNDTLDCLVRDRLNSTTERVSLASDGTQANGASVGCRISADGRYVAFSSSASNLVPGDTNNAEDVFVHDRTTHVTVRASVSSGGAQANAGSFNIALSADGRHVVFQSEASNLIAGDTNHKIDVFVRDLDP